jgi:tetratricopeptide (TPR) repeat protein
MTDADACFEEGMKHIGLSRHADYHSEYVSDLEDAIACFDRALALKSDHADALGEKGTALAALGRHAEAAEALSKAVRLRPESAQLWLERAGSLQRLGRHEEAIASCSETLRWRPGDADAMFCRAESLDALKQDADALSAWDEVLGEGDLRTMNFHGRAVRMLGSDFRRLRALLARAGALARLGRGTDAIDAYRKSIDEGAARDNSVSDTFSAALATHEAARAAYETYIESHAGDPSVWRTAGSNFSRAGRASDALAAYERAIHLAPGDADGWIGKAEALVQSGRRTESLAAFREALRVKPGYLAASLRMARVQKEIGQSQSDAKGPG